MHETQWSLNHQRAYFAYDIPETRWSLIPTTLTLHMQCKRHGILSFQLPLSYKCYGQLWFFIPIAPSATRLWETFNLPSLFKPLKYFMGEVIAKISAELYRSYYVGTLELRLHTNPNRRHHSQRAHDVNITSPQRRWRWGDVIFTSCACRVIVTASTKIKLTILPVEPTKYLFCP